MSDAVEVLPRWIWLGVAVGVVGMAVIGVGLTFEPWQPWVWVGVALLVGGAVVAVASGIMRDVYGGHGLAAEREAVLGGTHRHGAGPSTRAPALPVPDDAVTVNAGAHQGPHLEPAPTPIRMRFLALAMVLLGAWLILAPAVLHNPNTETGNDVILRDYTLAGLLILTGIALRDTRRSAVLCLVPAVAGAVLLLAAALSPAATSRMMVNEVVTGMLSIGFAAGYAVLRLSRE